MIYNILTKKGTFVPRLKRLGILMAWLVSSHIVQAEDLGVEEIVNPGSGEATIPIDGGASLLLAAAAGLGAYRLNRKQKEGKTKCDKR